MRLDRGDAGLLLVGLELDAGRLDHAQRRPRDLRPDAVPGQQRDLVCHLAMASRARGSARDRGPARARRSASPPAPPRRAAQNASATAAGAPRSSSDAWSARASRSTRRARARRSAIAPGRASQSLELRGRGVETRVARRAPARSSSSSAGSALGLARHRAQHVEADHVAGALPDRVERRLAVEARQDRTPRRSRCRRGTPSPRRSSRGARLHTQYLPTAVAMRAKRALARVARRLVVGARQPQHRAPSRPRTRARGRPARSASAAARRSRLPKALRCARVVHRLRPARGA